MKAIVYKKYGSPDVLKLEEIEKPIPGEGEILVRVYAASINSWDWDLLTGTPILYRLLFGLFKPKLKILGADIAGRVEEIGRNVTHFQVGDEVFGDISGCGWGGFAEYVCADQNALAQKPPSLTYDEAAAVPQAATLALQGLNQNGKIQPGHKVLINGAGGGVGTFAIQLAKLSGAEVTGVDHQKKLDMLIAIGADHVIDYTKKDFTKKGQRYDLILDVVGVHSIFEIKHALNPGGVYVMVGGKVGRILQMMFLGKFVSKASGKKMGLLMHKPSKDDLNYLSTLIEAGHLMPIVDKRYPLTQTAEAFRYYAKGQTKGKVIILNE